ncbi:tetratricopeptide repeat protein [Rhodanobacter ginsengiterrae]|uniref:tetratricopeptide repeat protein n=1 Tax=Rhodanobacter ginsengiterrae TaxID=2008451 RepID=UPI003CEDFA8F
MKKTGTFACATLLISTALISACNQYTPCNPGVDAAHIPQEIQHATAALKGRQSDITLLTCTGRLSFREGDFSAAERAYRKALALADSPRDRETLLQGLAASVKYLNHPQEAVDALTEKLKIDEALGDKESSSQTYATLASVYGDMGKFRESIAMSLASLPGLKSSSDTSATCNNIAMSYLSMQQFDQAQRYIDRSIALDTSSRNLDYLGIHRINKGIMYGRVADYAQAIPQLAQGISLTEQSGNKFWTMRGLDAMAFSLSRSGRTTEAVQALQRAEKLAVELGRDKERTQFAQSIERLSSERQARSRE